jgi:RND family efflux transporter MFP subunit
VHAGRIARLAPAIQEDTRTLLVEAEVPNERGQLRAGAFARAEIVTVAEEPAVLVPASAVVTFAGIEKVLTVRDGRAVETRVRTGRREGDLVEIVDGLTAGDAVVAEPGNLASGQPVAVREPASAVR